VIHGNYSLEIGFRTQGKCDDKNCTILSLHYFKFMR
jgi:hypothetical protein